MTASPKYKKQLLKLFSDFPFLMPGKFYGAQDRFYCMYIASRRMYSDPKILNLFGKTLGQIAKRLPIDAVCGAPTAGTPLAVSVSQQTGLPFLCLRDKRGIKGERNVIEGSYQPNWRIALIDDASGHGQTKKQMIQNIRKEGLVCNNVINLFSAEMPWIPIISEQKLPYIL
ncbi:MAG: hypothetical protein V1853_01240 [bacterium]